MKRYKVTPSEAPVTSITVEGVPWHYFHSNALGRCRAIIISPDENLLDLPPVDPCEGCKQGGWFIDPKDGNRKFLMPPYPGVDTICRVCGGYASESRKKLGQVRWGENE